MAAWLPVLKAVLPYLTTIVTAAVPAFTARKNHEQSANPANVVAQQIAELQDAVRRNAESVKLLAEQLQRTIHAIEAGAAAAERRLRKALLVSAASFAVAAASVVIVLVAR